MTKTLTALSICIFAGVGASPAAAVCRGDCSGDGQVMAHELILGIDIALGITGLDRCESIDADRDRRVGIDEITNAVHAAIAGCPPPEPRLVALSRRGEIASLDVGEPWTVRASGDLGAAIASARCGGGRCLVVHSSLDRISIVDASDLSIAEPIVLERGADPRDVALIDGRTAVVSQYGSPELLIIDLQTRATATIDLSELADDDGLPEALRLASCGRRVFVQLRRVDHETDAPAAVGGGLAVIDLDRPEGEQVVDADTVTPGTQAIALADRPNFDMPVDCAAGVLYVAEPAPLMQGGGGYEQVDLETLVASDFPIDPGAEVGGFEVVGPGQHWLITHTEFSPGPSSHLNFFVDGSSSDTYNTFADEHVNDLAFDRDEDLLFYPDPCAPGPANAGCDTGVHVFHAHTGERAAPTGIDIGLRPIEVVVSR